MILHGRNILVYENGVAIAIGNIFKWRCAIEDFLGIYEPVMPDACALPNLLAAMNILAFGFHELLRREDERCRMVRAKLGRRDTFFQDIAALMRYGLFASWSALMDFMMRGLEIGPYEPPQKLKTPRRIRAEARKKR